jgi:urocanate hydratase
MGGAQPLAATMAGASCLAVECQPSASRSGCAPAISTPAEGLDEALAIIANACAKKEAVSVGLLGNAADVLPELCARRAARRGDRPDLGARSAQRLPAEGWTLAEWESGASATRKRSRAAARRRSR